MGTVPSPAGMPQPMMMAPYCTYHHEHKSKIERNEADIKELKEDYKNEDNAIWKEVNMIKKWVIVGCGSMVLACMAIVGQFVVSATAKPRANKIIVVTDEQLAQIREMKTGN